ARRNGEIIRVSDQSCIQGCRMVATEEMFSHKSWPETWPEMVFARPKPNATLLRLCAVASGEWDAAMALWRKSDWDLAPGSLIVEEAGGLATTHLGEHYRFNQLIPAQRSLLSAGTKLHSLLRARVDHVKLSNPNANETPSSY
ncbi:MAG: inositol monophosphatase family protein, partial [Henriciella sp.]